MIIVEGPDGAGKTTLIRDLSRDLDLPVAPRVVSQDAEAMTDLKVWTERNVSEGFQPLIFDRHRLISEPIYGSILRDTFEPGFDDVEWLHRMMFSFYFCDPIIIYCLPPFDLVRKNITDDPHNRVVAFDIRRIYSLYVAKAAADIAIFPTTVFRYDYSALVYRDDIYAAIKERISHV